MNFPPPSRHFILLRSIHDCKHPVIKHRQSVFVTQYERPKFQNHITQREGEWISYITAIRKKKYTSSAKLQNFSIRTPRSY
jgi:hypothetical protein